MFGILLWLFSPGWNDVKLTLKAGFVCPFDLIDPSILGATTEFLCQSFCPSLTYPQCRKPAFLLMVIKLACLTEA